MSGDVRDLPAGYPHWCEVVDDELVAGAAEERQWVELCCGECGTRVRVLVIAQAERWRLLNKSRDGQLGCPGPSTERCAGCLRPT